MNSFIQSLTYFRIISGPAIFILVVNYEYFGWALIIFIFASSSDFWDGYLARKYKLESVTGAILDPIADKILLVFLLFALVSNIDSFFIAFASSVILAREFWVSALRDLNARRGRSQLTKVSFLAKLKTAFQLATLALYLLALYLNLSILMLFADFGLFASLIITIQTGLQYTIESFKKSQ